VLAVAWLGWWVRRPLLLPRLVALDEGRERALITRADRVAGAALVVVVVAVTAGGFLWAEQTYSRTIPLQGGRAVIKPLPRDPGNAVEVVVERATYDVPGRSMKIRARITNGSPRHLQFGEFATSNLRFVNRALPAAVARVDGGYPDDLVARNGLTVADNTPLAPGESRVVELEMTDAAWETERLTSLLNDPDNRVGGLLFCYAEDGARLIANVSGAIVPIFTDNATAMAH